MSSGNDYLRIVERTKQKQRLIVMRRYGAKTCIRFDTSVKIKLHPLLTD